jgi:small subunit ribosomal protein S21e
MQNEAGDHVDVYIPRKCSSTGRIITAKDHASVQVAVANVDERTGRMTGDSTNYCLCGFVRAMGESDDALNRLASKDKIAVGLSKVE